MSVNEIKKLLEKNKDERGIKHWEKNGFSEMTSYGIGVTALKKLAKQIGKNHDLALELWDENNFDCKIMATLIDDPKKVTRSQIDKQAESLEFWLLSHAYCNYLLPKVKGIRELSEIWINSKNKLKKRCGFLLIYQIAKNNQELDDSYFKPLLNMIKKDLQKEENFVKDAMNSAVFMIGQRSKDLNKLAVKTAISIGKVEVNYGDNSCKAMDVTSKLTSGRIQNKFNSDKN